jgi:3D (Asp-Asp-Asp) domain-containing protein
VLGQAHTSRRRLLPGVAIAIVVLVAPAVGLAGRVKLHSHHASLRAIASRRRAAVLGLYSLDRRLVLAHGRLTSLDRRETTLRAERASLAHGLVVARRSLRVARTRVATQLRYLYEEGTVSPIEVVFGAKTLDEAMTNIDDLGASSAANRALVAELEGAHIQLVHAQHALAVRAAAVAAAREQAAATAAALARTRAARAAYLEALAREQRLTAARIARVQVQAQSAVVRTSHLQSTRSTAAQTVLVGTHLTVSTTAYSLGGYTSSGLHTGWGVVAVDPSVIPLGTHMTIPGYGDAVAADTGTAIIGDRLDLWFPTLAMAQAWGRRTVTITLH